MEADIVCLMFRYFGGSRSAPVHLCAPVFAPLIARSESAFIKAAGSVLCLQKLSGDSASFARRSSGAAKNADLVVLTLQEHAWASAQHRCSCSATLSLHAHHIMWTFRVSRPTSPSNIVSACSRCSHATCYSRVAGHRRICLFQTMFQRASKMRSRGLKR